MCAFDSSKNGPTLIFSKLHPLYFLFCSSENVYQKQELCFLLFLIGHKVQTVQVKEMK